MSEKSQNKANSKLGKEEKNGSDNLNQNVGSENKKSMSIENFEMPEVLIKNLKKINIEYLFEIQARSFNPIFIGQDFVGRARTGQGKTLAFVLPVAKRIMMERKNKNPLFRSAKKSPLVIVLCPVRELAAQVTEVFKKTCGDSLKIMSVFGGVSYYSQISSLNRSPDVVIGTCGRIKDLINKRELFLGKIRFVILDEVDEMLNIGFADDVEEILNSVGTKNFTDDGTINENINKNTHQTLLFSATMPQWVKKISEKYLRNDYLTIDLVGKQELQTSRTVSHLAVCCPNEEKDEILSSFIAANLKKGDRAIIFADRKSDCNDLAAGKLSRHGCRVLHGDVPQKERTATIESFRKGHFSLLIATDVAARGISVLGVSHVIQIGVPRDHETYVHRSGRTGRAGAEGTSVVIYTSRESLTLNAIERKTGIAFKRSGVPNCKAAVTKTIKHFVEETEKMPNDAFTKISPYVKTLLKEGNIEKLLAAALLERIGDLTLFSSRSILSGKRGNVTLLLNLTDRVNKAEIFSWCRKNLFSDSMRDITNMTLFKDETGAAFDVSEDRMGEYKEKIDEVNNKGKAKIEIASETNIPLLSSLRLEQRTTRSGFSRNPRNGRSRWQNGNRNLPKGRRFSGRNGGYINRSRETRRTNNYSRNGGSFSNRNSRFN